MYQLDFLLQKVFLVTHAGIADEGEICVSGACLFNGYLAEFLRSNHTEGSESST